MTSTNTHLQEFQNILDIEKSNLERKVLDEINKFWVPIYAVSLKGRDMGDEKSVFILAKKNEKVLFYDDVEEEFGTATLDIAGDITQYSLVGSLENSILNFNVSF